MVFGDFKICLLQAHEGEAFFNLIDNNRVRLEDFFAGTVSKTRNLPDTLAYCKGIEQRILSKAYFPYMIIDVNTNAFIGLVDVKNIDWNVPKAELGYFIDSKYSGRGITTKAVAKVIEELIETHKFKKILCRVGSKNLGSIQVALNNNFKLEGTIRNDYRTTKGDIVDLNYYGRIFS